MKKKRQITLDVHLSRSLCEARHEYRSQLKRCRKKVTEKAVHDLRVETRRLLALLDFLDETYCHGSLDQPRKSLKKRLDAFDDLRDTHVQLEILKPAWRAFPEARHLKKLLERQEQKLIKKARQKVRRAHLGKLLICLKHLEERLGAADRNLSARQTENATTALQKSFDCVEKLRRRIHGNDAAAIHKMRVAFKRFRYLSELLQPFLPGVTEEQLEQMREFQSFAGAIQDLEVLLARLKNFIQEKKMPAIALRSLRSEVARRKHRAVDFFMKRIDDLLKFKPDGRVGELFPAD